MPSSATGGPSPAAGPSPPTMPASLHQLVVTVEALTAAAPQLQSTSTASAPSTPQKPPLSSPTTAAVATTEQLLKRVNDIQQQFSSLLEIAESAFPKAGKRELGLTSTIASSHDVHEQQADRLIAELENTVAELQRGLRSKLAQSSRISVLNALRREVAERQQCVAKMEGVLSVARQHVRL
ncbi:hypothetical protein ABL78_5407 [Leptomonas seymouri]|uniref:Uncharacterized protein n=1 Tax=Leptomonas seymouri TaxID=5684 RepID=A0A0N0P4P1_LEPSE|nr:hypothetical protein ABL78_5407 [Leptomonas seymouri]|eukprot:KPI85526.1 hypothetical protein ABL78_5407 [Leptomonas seymouri]